MEDSLERIDREQEAFGVQLSEGWYAHYDGWFHRELDARRAAIIARQNPKPSEGKRSMPTKTRSKKTTVAQAKALAVAQARELIPFVPARKYGWHPSTRPSLHPVYALPAHHVDAANIPASFDLSSLIKFVFNQGRLGSCTANALAMLMVFLMQLKGIFGYVPSRLMIYWGERAREGTIDTDAGANGDDGINFLATKGACSETTWPYDPTQFTVMPPQAAWAEAYHHTISGPVTIPDQDLVALKSYLSSTGKPIAFGIVAFPGLESQSTAQTGVVPMPGPFEQSIGGHEILLVGYDDASQLFKFLNSWGDEWGDKGFGYLPYAYVLQYASDFRSATSAK